MMPNVTRGGDMPGLVYYLAGPGRANEHTRPMIVAGDERITFRVEPGKVLTKRDAFEVAYQLDKPRRAHGTVVTVPVKEWDEEQQKQVKVGERDGHVWHCSLAIRPDDRGVTTEEWGRIARRFVEEMGFIDPDGAKSSRWVAIHHGQSKNGNDHIHIAVQMVREDGTKANVNADYHRVQEAARRLEREFNLAVVEGRSADRTLGAHHPAEKARAERSGEKLAVPAQLRQAMRAALATADSPLEYVQALQASGVTVAPSFVKGSRSQVRGYKVALPGRSYRTREGQYVFATPSKLDASLSWPNVCARFGGKGREEAERYLATLHGTGAGGEANRLHRPHQQRPIHPQHMERMVSGKKGTGPDTLANIYARLAIEHEEGRDGPLGRLSERMAQAVISDATGAYRVRQAARFGSRSSERGWLAVVNQANRLSRTMIGGQLGQDRPQLSRDVVALIAAAERVHRLVTPTTPARGAVREQYTERGNGYGRG